MLIKNKSDAICFGVNGRKSIETKKNKKTNKSFMPENRPDSRNMNFRSGRTKPRENQVYRQLNEQKQICRKMFRKSRNLKLRSGRPKIKQARQRKLIEKRLSENQSN